MLTIKVAVFAVFSLLVAATLFHFVLLLVGASSPFWSNTYCPERNWIEATKGCDGNGTRYMIRCRIYYCWQDKNVTDNDLILHIN